MDNITYSSISEIHNALMQRRHSPKELYEYITSTYFAWVADNSLDKIRGSEAEFHNLSVEFSRQDCEPYAAMVASIGVNEYPLSTDLLADLIKYSQETGDAEQCTQGFNQLKKIDRKYWSWRTFVFAIDFLKDGLSSSPSVEKFENNLTEAKVLIEDFKKYIPYEERAYVAEAELYQNQGDFAKAKAALQIGIKKVAVAPQCCMKLADMSLKLGRYDDVIKYARQGILAATQDQPTISVGYLHYILALAMDAKRIQCRQAGQSFDEIEIRKIINEFTTADRLLINEGRPDVAYRRTIKARLIVLEMEENIAVEIDQPDNKETHEGSSVRLSDILQIQQMLENAKKGVL